MSRRPVAQPLAGRRVLITGAARGIGAALARRLHQRGARVALLGLEEELLQRVAAGCGDTFWHGCDVTDRDQVDRATAAAVAELGGLDVVVANAGVGAQLPLVGGDPEIWERTLAVNLHGVYDTLRAAGPHVSHPGGYALAVASMAAAIHAPLMGAYNASKAGVEALANTLRIELRPSGARVGVAYFAEIEMDMTKRGFSTRAATTLIGRFERLMRPAALPLAVDALERGIARRSRRVVAPAWVAPLLPLRMALQPLVEVATQRSLGQALAIARAEDVDLTTPQPEPASAATASR